LQGWSVFSESAATSGREAQNTIESIDAPKPHDRGTEVKMLKGILLARREIKTRGIELLYT
jgi:hypothetical protein